MPAFGGTRSKFNVLTAIVPFQIWSNMVGFQSWCYKSGGYRINYKKTSQYLILQLLEAGYQVKISNVIKTLKRRCIPMFNWDVEDRVRIG